MPFLAAAEAIGWGERRDVVFLGQSDVLPAVCVGLEKNQRLAGESEEEKETGTRGSTQTHTHTQAPEYQTHLALNWIAAVAGDNLEGHASPRLPLVKGTQRQRGLKQGE